MSPQYVWDYYILVGVNEVVFAYGFPGSSDSKAFACNAGDLGSIPGLGRSPGEENGNPLQYSCLANSVDRGGVQFVGLQRVRNDWENNTLTWYFPTDAHRNIFNTWREQNKITCSNISSKFPIWVWFSTASFIYEIKKLLFCTASDPIPCLYLHVGFVCMLLKE